MLVQQNGLRQPGIQEILVKVLQHTVVGVGHCCLILYKVPTGASKCMNFNVRFQGSKGTEILDKVFGNTSNCLCFSTNSCLTELFAY